MSLFKLNISNKLRLRRLLLSKTLDDIYLETGIWPSRLSRIERGIFSPHPREKEKISKALKCLPEEIFPEE